MSIEIRGIICTLMQKKSNPIEWVRIEVLCYSLKFLEVNIFDMIYIAMGENNAYTARVP